MITKALIRKTLEEMPEKFTIDQFIDHLSLVQKIERGIKQSEEGKFVSHEQAMEEIESWFN
jgi:predicted transcriptional regulator